MPDFSCSRRCPGLGQGPGQKEFIRPAFSVVPQRLAARCLTLVVLLFVVSGVQAETGWVSVVQDGARVVQIDQGSVLPSDGGTRVAWARVLLSATEAATSDHVAVHSLNRYDCVNRNLTTLRRRFVDGQNIIVREEAPTRLQAQPVVSGTVDERLWRAVCQPASLGDLARIAAQAERIVAEAPSESLQTGVSRRGSAITQAAAPVSEAVVVSVARAASDAASTYPVEMSRVETESADRIAAALEEARALSAARAAQRAPAVPGLSWSYHGDRGPENWGRLSPDWKLCASGQRQSPVNLGNGIHLDLEPPGFQYVPTRFRVSDSGRALEVTVGAGLSLSFREHVFELEQLSFHNPSEILIEGRASPLSVHLHHRAADGTLAIVVVMFELGPHLHAELQTILNNLPLDRGGWFMPRSTLDPTGFLPVESGHFEFHGSLSTPPCTEGVAWVVMKSPLMVSAEQLEILQRLHLDNRRPVQALNNRLILETR